MLNLPKDSAVTENRNKYISENFLVANIVTFWTCLENTNAKSSGRHSGRNTRSNPVQIFKRLCWMKWVQTPARGRTFFPILSGKPAFDSCNQCTYGFLAESEASTGGDVVSSRQMTQLSLSVWKFYANFSWTWYFRADAIDMRENIQIFMVALRNAFSSQNGKFLVCSVITWTCFWFEFN